MKSAIVCGNPSPQSRTLGVAHSLAQRLTGGAPDYVLELSGIATELFDYRSEAVAAAKRQVLECDLLIIASPTYKASFTGLLKAFLDHFGAGELSGTFTVPVMTAGSDKHHLAAETQLRPVLVELGATVCTECCTVVVADTTDLDGAVDAWIERNRFGINLFGPQSTSGQI